MIDNNTFRIKYKDGKLYTGHISGVRIYKGIVEYCLRIRVYSENYVIFFDDWWATEDKMKKTRYNDYEIVDYSIDKQYFINKIMGR